MSRIRVQAFPTILSYSGSLAGGASVAGSAVSQGFSRIIGIAWSDASGVGGSGLRISQAPDGATFKYITACGVAASASSGGYSIEVIGSAVEVRYVNGATVASNVYLNWMLRPI